MRRGEFDSLFVSLLRAHQDQLPARASVNPELEVLDPNILELRHHGRSGMKLQRQHAAHGSLRFAIVRHVNGLLAVDELLEVIAFGDDHVVVPVALLDRGFDRLGISDRADDLLLVLVVPDDLLATPAKASGWAAVRLCLVRPCRSGLWMPRRLCWRWWACSARAC